LPELVFNTHEIYGTTPNSRSASKCGGRSWYGLAK
jgi:hypothetical protein